MVPTMLLSRCISIDLLSLIGFGDLIGLAMYRLGTGVTGLVGMLLSPVGRMPHIAPTSMCTIMITPVAPIAMRERHLRVVRKSAALLPAQTMRALQVTALLRSVQVRPTLVS